MFDPSNLAYNASTRSFHEMCLRSASDCRRTVSEPSHNLAPTTPLFNQLCFSFAGGEEHFGSGGRKDPDRHRGGRLLLCGRGRAVPGRRKGRPAVAYSAPYVRRVRKQVAKGYSLVLDDDLSYVFRAMRSVRRPRIGELDVEKAVPWGTRKAPLFIDDGTSGRTQAAVYECVRERL